MDVIGNPVYRILNLLSVINYLTFIIELDFL